jgi:hypothetical protein
MVPYLMSLLLLVFSYPGIHQLDWEAHQGEPPAVKVEFQAALWYNYHDALPLNPF